MHKLGNANVESRKNRLHDGGEEGGSAQLRILLAEDDAEARSLLSYALRKDGHHVIEVSSGSELLDHLGLSRVASGLFDSPDLVITDVRMPGFSGMDVLMGLTLADWSVPVILITGFGDDELHKRAHALGALAVFDKPFDVEDLRTFVTNVMKIE